MGGKSFSTLNNVGVGTGICEVFYLSDRGYVETEKLNRAGDMHEP